MKVARIDPEAKRLGISHCHFRLLLSIPGQQLYTTARPGRISQGWTTSGVHRIWINCC